MSPYLGFGVARIVLLVLLGSLFLSLATGRPLSRRLRLLVFGVLVAALLSYPNFGFFHGRSWGPIHYGDVYHYFVGAKYLPELGYSRLYEATFVAGRELGFFGSVTTVRDLTTYDVRRVDAIDAQAVRARFSPERWLAFKGDLAFLIPRVGAWPGTLFDHGYNDPPPRALLLHLLVRRVPANVVTLALLTSLDYVLIAAGLCVVWRAFGAMPTSLTFAFLGLSFFARFDWIGGSLLRWDWIVALLVGVAAYARGSGGAAGVCFGYAALARIFPMLFLVPLGLKWLQGRLGRRPDPTVARCLGAAGALVLVVAVGLVVAGQSSALLSEYASKIRLHTAIPSTNRVGLGSLLTVSAAPWSLTPEGTTYVIQAALMDARPAQSMLLAISALYVLVALPLIRRAQPLESMMYAAPLIFFALSPTGYYYAFLVLLVLLPWQGGSTDGARLVEMALLTFTMAVSYAFEFTAGGALVLFYQASIQMGLFFVVWLVLEYLRIGSRPARLVRAVASPGPAQRGSEVGR